MKKVLSLLSMLMVTVTAFATSYTDKLTYKLTVMQTLTKELPAGELTVEPYGTSNYTVTAKGCDLSAYDAGNWDEIVCEDVAGTKDANGVTTITLDNPYAYRTSDNTAFTDTKLVVKFNGTKAYAHFEGKMKVMYVARAFEYTFGTDEGFEGSGSTGGGETGGEEKPAIVENWQSTEGVSWSHDATIDWNTQKLVVSVNLASTGSDKGFLGVTKKGNTPGWNNDGIIFYNNNASTIQGFAPGQPNNANTDYITKGEDPVRFEISKDGGVVCQGNVVITASNIAHLTSASDIVVGAADKVAGALYNYIKVVSLDWTETTKPEVTVKEEKIFTDAISMVVGDMSEVAGQAQVTIKEMTDETISMTLAVVGQEGAEYTASGFTKTVDTEKNRTTYTGTLNIEDEDYDVTALVYTEGTVEKLYMVAKGAEYNYVIGTNPDAPTVVYDKTYTSNLKLTDAESEEDVVDMPQADVNIIKYSDDSYKITLKQVALRGAENDLIFVGTTPEVAPTAEAAEPLYLSATPNTATKAILGDVTAIFAISEVSDDEIKMGIAIEGEGILYEGDFNYEEEVDEPEVYTSNLHIYDAAAPETDLFQADQAKVEFLATATGEFKLTLKDVTLNEKTQDLVFTGTLPTTEPGGQEPLAEEGEGEVTPDEPAMVLNATADEATATFLGAASATAEFSISYNAADEFMMTFTMKAGEKNYGGEFNYEVKTPAVEPFCKENYVADGNGFEWEIPVDWDTQKIVMSIDPSTCTGSCEHVIGLGASPTTFHGNLQLYRTSADQMLQGYFENDGGNHNTGKFAETAPFLVEVSKAKGFVVNDEVKITASEMSELFTLPTVKMGTGEGVNDKSRATYNYVKVVDKDWTTDHETGINATTVAEGEFEVFSVDGVKLSKLQKGLNIVRSADGKVKKVLVK